MKYLSIDVETTGIPAYDIDPLDPGQPRIAAVGAVGADEAFLETCSCHLLIQPDGWTMGQRAAAVNGLTTEKLTENGISIKIALATMVQLVKQARYLVLYNGEFERFVVKCEIARLESSDLGLDRPRLRIIDPMLIGTSLMPDGKYPKLIALYEHLTGQKMENAHSALADARAALKCAQILIERGLVPL